MKRVLRIVLCKIRPIIWKIIGMSNPHLPVYRCDFPEGKIVGEPLQMGRYSIIDYGGNVTIGKNVKIGYGVFILSVSTITANKAKILKAPIYIGDNVEIGSNAVVLPGIRIGNNSTIGAGAVVTKSIPENSIAIGVPAKVIRIKN